MRKNFILDTNVLLHDPNAVYKFGIEKVIIPVEVIEELDRFKREISELGHNSRAVSTLLAQFSKKGKLGKGVSLDNGGELQVYGERCEDVVKKKGLALKKSVDNRLLNLALHLKKCNPEKSNILISKNINLRIKADVLGIETDGFEEDESPIRDIYAGVIKLSVGKDVIESFRDNGFCHWKESKFFPNQYILLQDESGDAPSTMARAIGRNGNKLVPVQNTNSGILGIRPLNIGQCFAFDALLDDKIKLVTLLGKAGTGKTLLAVAAGLHKVINEDKYNKILISRPIMPLGRDIGYIPGDVEEKMRPWMQPIYDALEMLKEQDRRSKKKLLPPDLLESEEIGIEPLTYIRGRSIPHQFFMIDEAQNLTPHEVKTIITRVGYDSKVVLTGDTEQIDNPYVDSFSNGFSYLVHKFRQEEISAHITLTKGERSDLAEVATKLL